MKKNVLRTSLLVLVLILSISLFVTANSLPQQSDYPEAGTVIIDSRTKVDYTELPYEIKVTEKIKLFNKRGINKFGELKIRFNKKAEEVKIIDVETVKPDGTVVKADDDAVHEITPPELSKANIYSNAKVKVVNMPALESGSVIKYTYVKKIKEATIEDNFSYNTYFQTTEPIINAELEVAVPVEREIFYESKPADLKAEVIREDNIKKYLWKEKNIAAVKEEPSMPPLPNLLSFVKISSIKNWETMSDWYNGLLTDQYQINSSIRKQIEQLTKDKNTKKDSVAAIYNYVATKIRYVGLEYGIGGYKPHKAIEVYKNKYGDCKDKATLLIAMLSEIGIKAEPVLINSAAEIDLELPSIANFNHMIVYIPEYNMFLDPTSELTRFGDLPPADQGKEVFLPTLNDLKETPVKSAKNNREEIFQTVIIDKDGNASIEIDWQDYGYYDSVYKDLFRRYDKVRWEMIINQIINRSFSNSQVKDYTIEGVTGLEERFSMNLKVENRNYLQQMGNTYIVKPIKLPLNIHQLGSLEEREHPLHLGVTMKFRRKINIEFPDEFKIDYLPEDKNVENEIGQLNVDYSKKNNKVIVDLNLAINKKEISADNYKKAKSMFEKLKNILQNQISFKKK